MRYDARASFDDIPIIGKAFEIVTHYPTAVIQCGCEGKNVFVLIGAMSIVECNGCHRQYAIAEQPKLTVGIVRTSVPVVG